MITMHVTFENGYGAWKIGADYVPTHYMHPSNILLYFLYVRMPILSIVMFVCGSGGSFYRYDMWRIPNGAHINNHSSEVIVEECDFFMHIS